MYLSATTQPFFNDIQQGIVLHGIMFNTYRKTGREFEALLHDCKFGVDNGVYSGRWVEREWLMRLYDFLPFCQNCLVCPLPDWLDKLPDGTVMGDWRKTIDRFHEYKQVTKRLGFPVTLVTQDGLIPKNTPWPELDALFIGGSNYHKRGLEAEELAKEAKKRGLWVHVGRVSSISAAEKYWPWADSYDGTTYTYEPDKRYKEYTPQWRRFFNNARAIQGKLV